MPRRGRSNQTPAQGSERAPALRQVKFPTQKQTKRSTCLPWSALSRKQQTITQMVPFHALYHPDEAGDQLEYDEEGINNAYSEPPRNSKRRKTMPEETPLRRVTRSAQHKVAASVPNGISSEENVKTEPRAVVLPAVQAHKAMDPPFVTPKRSRKKIIPSSQSSAGTPLSTRSHRSGRDISRSPLKEKSANIGTPRSPAQRQSLLRRREIPDSMENENEMSHPPSFRKGFSVPASEEEERCSLQVGEEEGAGRTESDADADEENFISTSQDMAAYGDYFLPELSSNKVQQLTTPDSPASIGDHKPTKTESQEAAQQLLNDLRRSTQAPAQLNVQTDSQFESEWHTYKPPDLTTPPASSLHTSPSSDPTIENRIMTPCHKTKPPSHCPANAPFDGRRQIPPSQATTIAGTQPSFSKYLQSSSQNIPSSPPPPPTSSPIANRAATEENWRGLEWDADARLTDSQLLPESLMHDSLIGPPEDWRTLIDESISDEDTRL